MGCGGEGWYGPRWCNLMFLGRVKLPGNMDPIDRHSISCVSRYLDIFDRDLLALNLKACSAVLKYLEAKCSDVTLAEDDSLCLQTQ